MNIYKVIVVGDVSVGKTSIARRYISDEYSEYRESTIITSYLSKRFPNYRMDIWDSAGQEQYHSLVEMYFRGAATAIIVFSKDNFSTSFSSAKRWIKSVKEQTRGQDVQILLVQNKIDLATGDVDEMLIQRFCDLENMQYFRVSAKTGEGIH